MSKEPKKKLCWNCEGSVSLNSETCPYCGVSVIPATLEGVQTTFSPPYRMGMPSEVSQNAIPASPFAMLNQPKEKEEESKESDVAVKTATRESENEMPLDEFKTSLMAITFLLMGSVFFIFSIALAIFSKNGTLTLQWDGSLWFIYCFAALPLLFLGWRSLLKLEDN